eukprot:COSAG04_NODE_2342_length_4295_cov_168.358913_4_plen_84_part_00
MKLHSGKRSQVSTISAYFDAYVAANYYTGRRCECMPDESQPTWEVVRADQNGCEQKAGIVAEAEGEATLQKRGDEVEVSQVAG